MKKFSTLLLAVAVALVGSFVAPKSAEAVPAFARQVGVGCLNCHRQTIGNSRITAFGREFQLGGYTQSSQELLEDDGLSIPPVANIGFIEKMRYIKTTEVVSSSPKVGTERGRLDVYDEAAIWLAGRLGENWGMANEFGAGNLSTKVIYSADFGGVQGGFVVGATDGLGVSFGMEIFNTGAAKNHRPFENKGATNAQFAASTGALGAAGPSDGEATFLGVFGGNGLFFFNVSLFGPASTTGSTSAIDTNFDLSNYIRVAVTPSLFDGVETMIGVQITSGKTKLDGGIFGGIPTDIESKSTAIDFQVAMDDLAGMSLEVTGAFVTNPTSGATVSAYNSGPKDASAYDVTAVLGLTKNAGLKLALLQVTSDGTAADAKWNATTFGGYYDFLQNVSLHATFTTYSGSSASKPHKDALYVLFQVGL